MEEGLKIPVTYKGEELQFEAKLIPWGYIHRFVVDVEGIEVYFEPDDERLYIALLSEDALQKNLSPNVELVKLIHETLNRLASKNR